MKDNKYNLREIKSFENGLEVSGFDYLNQLNDTLDRMIEKKNPADFKWLCLSLFGALNCYACIISYESDKTFQLRNQFGPSKFGFSFVPFWRPRPTLGFMKIIEKSSTQRFYGDHKISLTNEDFANIQCFYSLYRNKIVHPSKNGDFLTCDWYLVYNVFNITKRMAIDIINPIFTYGKIKREALENLLDQIDLKIPDYGEGGSNL